MKTRQEIVEEVGRNLTNRYTTLMNELRGYIGHAWKSGYWKGLEDAKPCPHMIRSVTACGEKSLCRLLMTQPPAVTNADRIRRMTDEQLVELIVGVIGPKSEKARNLFRMELTKFMKQEAEKEP